MTPTQPIKLYRSLVSGHAHRAELFLALLGLPYTAIDIDLKARQQKSPEFLALNVFGQVPVIDDNGVVIADSHAILVYLASKYDDSGTWLPREPYAAAQVQRWLSVAAGLIAFGPAAARAAKHFGAPHDPVQATARAKALFDVMEAELASRPYLAGTAPTIADIAGYSYIVRAPEGGISLEPYPNLRAWLARVEALPGFVPMMVLPGAE